MSTSRAAYPSLRLLPSDGVCVHHLFESLGIVEHPAYDIDIARRNGFRARTHGGAPEEDAEAIALWPIAQVADLEVRRLLQDTIKTWEAR